MGKCSGLKGGGHHRKALDVAEKKRTEKAARKKEQVQAGKRGVILQQLLCELDPDADIYLLAEEEDGGDVNVNGHATINNGHNEDGSSANTTTALPELCRLNFRYDDCSNRRCKFSHQHSIANALGNVVSGSNSSNNNNNSGSSNNGSGEQDDTTPTTIPALRLIPGVLCERRCSSTSSHRRRQQRQWKITTSSGDADDIADNVATDTVSSSPFEAALSEGSSVVNSIVEFLESDIDVLHLSMTCRYLHQLVFFLSNGDGNDDNNGDNNTNNGGCKDVQRRRYRAKERKLQRRNEFLLQSKAVSGRRLRYAVSYVSNNNNDIGGGSSSNNIKIGKKKKNGDKRNNNNNNKKNNSNNSNNNVRPILVFDYENPHVFRAFQEYGGIINKNNNNNNNNNNGLLSSSFARDCNV